jgi:WD40 repeat protein
VRDGPRLAASLAAEWSTAAPARQLAFSRDGGLLATSDASGLILVRETGSWRPVAKFHHEGGATSVAFGADGKTLLSGGYDGNVRIWDLERRAPAGLLRGSSKTIWAIDVSPDGARLAAGGEDSAIRLWTLDRPATPAVLRGHERNVWEVRFSPDGKLLASGSFDRNARLWDGATGNPLRILAGHEQAVVGLAFSPDGKRLATCGDDSTIRFWRVADGALLRTIRVGNHTYKLAFSSDGRWLVSGGRARGAIGTFWHQLAGGGSEATPVRIWRASDGALVSELPAPDDIAYVAFSPDGQWLAAAEDDNRVRLWRLRRMGR